MNIDLWWISYSVFYYQKKIRLKIRDIRNPLNFELRMIKMNLNDVIRRAIFQLS